MSDDLKDTFDGYLMFDFSNFHGLMAQSFDNESIDLPKVDKIQKRKAPTVPGPYLDTPLMDMERSGDVSEGILYNGLDEDDIPEINLDDDCLSNFNYSSSGFNLLANLDFEPDDDAYENAINITGGADPSTQNQRSTKTNRTKKISIFSPTLQFDENGEQKIQMINIQNLDTLKEDRQLDDFYKFLRQLDFLNFSNFKQNDDPVKVDQLVHLVQIRVEFEKMNELFQKKCEQSHSISFTSKLHFFQQQLEHFTQMVNFIVDNGTTRQKFQRDQQNTLNRDFTLTMSMAFFKGLEIIQQFKVLQLQKSMIDRQNRIKNAIRILHSAWRLNHILIKGKCEFVPRKDNHSKASTFQLSLVSNSQNLQSLSLDYDKLDLLQKIGQSKEPQRMVVRGLDKYFGTITEEVPRSFRKFRRINHSKYLSFDGKQNEENYFHYQ